MNRAVRSVLAFVSLFTLAALAHAGPAAETVTARRNEVVAKMKEAASKERDQKVAAIMGQMFDFDAMGKASLGKEWAGLNDEQRAEFLSLLKQLVQKSIEKNVRSTMSYDLELLGEESADAGTLVKTKATNKKNGREEPVAIDYLLHEISGGWRVKDIVTEGSSMVGNYKSQFVRIIKKDGFDALTKKMKDKLKKGE